MLPVGPTGFGDSPYQSLSAFAGNTLVISPEDLAASGYLDDADLEYDETFSSESVDFAAASDLKRRLLDIAFARFEAEIEAERAVGFEDFLRRNAFWLDDFSLYIALKIAHNGSAWSDWEEDLKLRKASALADARQQFDRQILRVKFEQFIFFDQWTRLKAAAAEHGVLLIGDVPMFAAYDSADVWCNKSMFKLNEDGTPRVVAGVPPDHFSETGQLWGNPIYDWDAMRRDGFSWWAAVMYRTLKLFDIVRLDHFRGFFSTWEVPGGDETAENGQWVNVPGRELFAELQRGLGELPIIVEDLGFITDEVESLRGEFGFPGMRVLQFGFGGDAKSRDLPHNFDANTVVYTGTHDNDTTVGWWKTLTEPDLASEVMTRQAEFAREYLLLDADADIADAMIQAAYSSVADIAVVPMQDVLGLDSSARMNTPSTIGNNWKWRMTDGAISPPVIEGLRKLGRTYGRVGWSSGVFYLDDRFAAAEKEIAGDAADS